MLVVFLIIFWYVEMQRSHCIRLMIRWIWKATIITRVPIRSNPIQSTLGVGRHVLIII